MSDIKYPEEIKDECFERVLKLKERKYGYGNNNMLNRRNNLSGRVHLHAEEGLQSERERAVKQINGKEL